MKNKKTERPTIIITFCKIKTQYTIDKRKYIFVIYHKNLFFGPSIPLEIEFFCCFGISINKPLDFNLRRI